MSASATTDLLRYTCPRCAVDVESRFYGPCDECRPALRVDAGNRHVAWVLCRFLAGVVRPVAS